MLFLVELDHVKSGMMPTPEAGRAFIEQVIFPTTARAEQLIAVRKILAGGPVAGRISLRLIVEADSLEDVDRIISSLPLWMVADTRVTPLIAFTDRRDHVQTLLESLTTKPNGNKNDHDPVHRRRDPRRWTGSHLKSVRKLHYGVLTAKRHSADGCGVCQ